MQAHAAKLATLTGAIVILLAVTYLLFAEGTTPEASANNPNAGLEYRLAVGSCSTAGDAKGNCVIPTGATFVANVYLDSIAGIGNGSYDSLLVTVAYAGVTSNNDPDIVWPECVFQATAIGPGFSSAGCSTGISAPSSTYTGLVFTASFVCLADGTLSLTHGAADTQVVDSNAKTNVESGPDC